MQRRTIHSGGRNANSLSNSSPSSLVAGSNSSLPITQLSRTRRPSSPVITTTITNLDSNCKSNPNRTHNVAQRVFPDVHCQTRFPQATLINEIPQGTAHEDADQGSTGTGRKRTWTDGQTIEQLHNRMNLSEDEVEDGHPVKKRRSIGGAILETAIDTVIFTGAVAYTAYKLWKGSGKETPKKYLTNENSDMDEVKEEEMISQKSAPTTPSTSTPKSVYRVHMSHSRSGSRASSARRLKAHHIKSSPKKSKPKFKDDNEDDPVFTRFQEKLSKMINEGKAALQSKVEVWDLQEDEGEESDQDEHNASSLPNSSFSSTRTSSQMNHSLTSSSSEFPFRYQSSPLNPFIQSSAPHTRVSLDKSQTHNTKAQQQPFIYSTPSFRFSQPPPSLSSTSSSSASSTSTVYNNPFSFGSTIETSPFRTGSVEPFSHHYSTGSSARIPRWTFSPNLANSSHSQSRNTVCSTASPSNARRRMANESMGGNAPQGPTGNDISLDTSSRVRNCTETTNGRPSMPGEWGAGW